MEEEETFKGLMGSGAQYIPKSEPNYPVLELQAENEKLRSDLIDAYKKRIFDLEAKVEYLEGLFLRKDDEKDVGSNMINPPLKNMELLKPRFRTMSEVARKLEERTRNIAEAKISAEDLKHE